MAGTGPTDEFAALLRLLKERAGLSYGTLAKRLHLSTSTLHRYCNGDAVPVDYAPVERLARACRARPDELVELHRLWVVATATRQAARRAEQAAGAAGAAPSAAAPSASVPSASAPRAGSGPASGGTDRSAPPVSGDPVGGDPVGGDPVGGDPAPDGSGAGASGTAGAAPDPRGTPDSGDAGETGEAGETGAAGAPAPGAAAGVVAVPVRGRGPRRRTTVLIGVAVATALCAGSLVALLSPWGEKKEEGARAEVAATAGARAAQSPLPRAPRSAGTPSASPSPSRSAGPGTSGSPSPSSRASASASSGGHGEAGPQGAAPGGGTDGTPVTVGVTSHVWENPCGPNFLVDRQATQVPPPPTEQDAPGWTSALGAVASDEQLVRLTVQGTGSETVVLEQLAVRTVRSAPPLAWNDFSSAVGCGGGVETASYAVDLDSPRPRTTPEAGQPEFAFKTSHSDPEVFYVRARTRAHDVSWYLELHWSSGNRRGVLRIDDHGQPFRTSANNSRPGFDYPLGSSGWEARLPQDPATA
ncbi:helix-turn-helix domain-containing protein [Streptomyces sp. LP05-1]|uniref:Helix-turn-helix domain-containing protein n=1 Tax=Streptomyces pyxinae TaxID=2970734 RepID=A0ABT2CE75_9ACTN|nr:helix-turn-helix transcriptional regulator [Streptomyces sp. LP05-1]MCS0635661.1 helix-turn-helix domain-containing protein [Streptomyces sp. LP05-1]